MTSVPPTPCDVTGHRSRFGLWLVVAGGVELDVAQGLAGRGDADVEVLHQDQDGLSAVASADADVVEAGGAAEGEPSAVIDEIVATPARLTCPRVWF